METATGLETPRDGHRRTGLERVKTWPAYLLAVLCPGAGHLAVGEWTRGLSWAGLCGIALVFLSPGSLLVEGALTEPIVVTALRLEGATFGDVAFPFAIIVLSVIDLYTRLTFE
ncbi:hypothetical protein GS429_07090 [Natronorubrum sp. JWXQ-INN-674]|uniref:Uncharacterized protein n=1 Tax=Natronorubrum halalkaliphilum TaxID=2691917 RepID=A0A6B0VJW7_9EURY|nr:hypothetical protein [Natronorubrum halalkaliphilum]MXV61834.1 hypothetical protein [Natronorubrum halalkaliphilum]